MAHTPLPHLLVRPPSPQSHRRVVNRRPVATLMLLILALIALMPRQTEAQTPEMRAAAILQSIRDEPLLLQAFLQTMPKGGDLHVHPSGAMYAESMIAYAAEDGLCVVLATHVLVSPPCEPDAGRVPASTALTNQALYDALVDAWSMRDFVPSSGVSGHDQFFAAFSRFGLALATRGGDMLADVMAGAAREGVSYLELMSGLDGGRAARLGAQVGWNPDLAQLREQLLAAGMAGVVAAASAYLDESEARMRERLSCNSTGASDGCHVTVQYLQTGTRVLPPEQVFAQLVAGFELVRADPRVVGVNLLAPEDAYVARRDYRLHMAMLDYLHSIAPEVPIALHAGELTPGLVPPEDLRFHIREAVERGHARRIGHGVSIMYEDDPFGLMEEMRRRNVLVEILLVSSDQILGIRGRQHPFPLYMRAGVPVALATDDAGVSRSSMTAQYQLAVELFGLGYADLKRLARTSIEYGFLSGASLWADVAAGRRVAACSDESFDTNTITVAACREVVNSSQRAWLQWRLEVDFAGFERRLSGWGFASRDSEMIRSSAMHGSLTVDGK
jgi:adenosine deaminase